MEGEITYSNEESFLKIYKRLREGLYIDEHNYFLDENGHQITEFPTLFFDKKQVYIPRYRYRNLTNLDFFKEDGVGYLIGTSTDGCFAGWIQIDKSEAHYDLLIWAAEYLNEKDENIPDPNTDFDAYCEWQSKIEAEFFDYAEECASFGCTFLQ